MTRITTPFSSVADLAALHADLAADLPHSDAAARLIAAGEGDMPDPDQAAHAAELLVRTLFDLLGETQLATYADRLAWGVVHSFHKVAESIEAQADAAALEVKRLAYEQDGSEVAGLELEDAQARCQALDAAGEAIAALRDAAAETYRAETGRPWSSPRGSCVSSKRTASVIAAADYLKARADARRQRLAPDGPVVVFSGGQRWHDHALIYARLDAIHARVPHMVLATTAQTKGCDAIAAAWAAARRVALVAFTLNPSLGRRAAFQRNERLARLAAVEAVVCEGSGVQANLYQRLRASGVPCQALRYADQRADSGD